MVYSAGVPSPSPITSQNRSGVPPTNLALAPVPPEHLTPHDLVTYFRCPREMELRHRQREAWRTGHPLPAIGSVPPEARTRSPLPPPPIGHLLTFQGRLDVFPTDVLIYEDPEEDGLPILFPPERNQTRAFLQRHGHTLVDPSWGLSGRPDLVIRRRDGSLVPVEYKETHLWERFHEVHGRLFDLIQVLAECRLVEVTWGQRPRVGIVYYGDGPGGGEREGWVELAYGDEERAWLEHALLMIRQDRERPPIPSETHCSGCEMNRDHLCPQAAVPFGRHRGDGGDRAGRAQGYFGRA
jgi:CRISPR/Cas system-associated exonuclease Cas4 (RecB family)